jgi:hypothetical protein
MTHTIEASWDTLVRQASLTATDYLNHAVEATENLPKGVDRSVVIAAFINAAASDFRSASICIAAQMIRDELMVIGARHE